MKINRRQLDQLVDAAIDLPDGQVMWAIQEHYCKPLTLLGMCDECSSCAFYLDNAFARFRAAENPTRPVGLFVYLIRDERESYRENFRRRKKRSADQRPIDQTLLEET